MIKAESVATEPNRLETPEKAVMRQPERVLRLIVAQQDEQVRAQKTAAVKIENPAQANSQTISQPEKSVVTVVHPRVEKLAHNSKPSKSKPSVKVEVKTNQGASPVVHPFVQPKFSNILTAEKTTESTAESNSDEAYELALPVGELAADYQVFSDTEQDVQEISLLTAESEEYFSIAETPAFFEADDTDLWPVSETMPPLIERADAEVSNDTELIFDEEVRATFEKISLLNEVITAPIASDERNTFAELVSATTMPEKLPAIEAIIAAAPEQTLEETFVQLSFYLAEDLTETNQEADTPGIEVVLKEIAELLPVTEANPADQETKINITPELTQKLLALLRAVGYDNPQEILVECIERHGWEFLVETIRYLYQLTDDANRQEFSLLKTLNFTAMKVDEPLATRLGQAIMQYFFMHKISPGL